MQKRIPVLGVMGISAAVATIRGSIIPLVMGLVVVVGLLVLRGSFRKFFLVITWMDFLMGVFGFLTVHAARISFVEWRSWFLGVRPADGSPLSYAITFTVFAVMFSCMLVALGHFFWSCPEDVFDEPERAKFRREAAQRIRNSMSEFKNSDEKK